MSEISNNQGVEVLGTSNNNVALTPATNAVVINDEATALKAELEKLKVENALLTKSKNRLTKAKSPYNKVTERFRTSFGSQVIKTAEAKKAVFAMSLAKTKGLTKEEFCVEFRDNIFDRLMVNIKFVSECVTLEVNAFEAAQFIVLCGNPTVEAVLKQGVASVFDGRLSELQGEIFSEEELAIAKFSTLTGKPTESQLSEASRLISAVSQVLDSMKTAS